MVISRRGFVRDALGTAAALAGLASADLARASEATGSEDDYYRQLVKANDAEISAVIERLKGARERFGVRAVGEAVDALAGAYCAPESSYYKSPDLLPVLEAAADKLLAAQNPDGTIDAGNLCSPPDTAFVVQTVCMALTVLQRMNLPQLATINSKLAKFVLEAGEAIS